MNPSHTAKLVRAQNDSIYNMSCAKKIPELPPLPPSVDPSELYQMIQKSSYYPTLMQRASWTLAAPFKEQRYFRSPSNSIANNYTLTARNLKMMDLQKIVSPIRAKKIFGSAKQKAGSSCILHAKSELVHCSRPVRGGGVGTSALDLALWGH
ncbi:hypothetical protein JD844_019827 [Phrynosoma platyrhinos]|uniref:Uncharacterized protein n=1 Tax=Phrynosoma platyrhinos TaxID=52577 RepID=A0ABQ7TR70_PHRPL|nr:hypothetical protein JD844_019827 [Phrynosoma platyrhinos]